VTAPVNGIVEAEKAAAAFQVALIKIGAKTIAQALALWRRVPANKGAEVSAEWLDDAVRMVMQRRELARDLAMAYYRLTRALRTGATVPDPQDPTPATATTLGDLRDNFQRLVDASNGPASASPTSDTPSTRTPADGDSVAIPVEHIDGLDDNGDAEDARLEADAENEARIVLEALGPTRLQKLVSEIDNDRPASEVDELRDQAHAKAGSLQAASADRIVKNGARNKLTSLADRDKRVIGYVRLSRTGTPCGWCAMLISRGFVPTSAGNVIYNGEFPAVSKTARAKSVREGKAQVGDQYHNNCNCYAEPVYGEAQLNEPMFDLNREYARLWPIVTKGKSGDAALSAWRRYFRTHIKGGDADPGKAQAA
jgi:hypothetical protein